MQKHSDNKDNEEEENQRQSTGRAQYHGDCRERNELALSDADAGDADAHAEAGRPRMQENRQKEHATLRIFGGQDRQYSTEIEKKQTVD